MKNKLLVLAALTAFCFGMDYIETAKQNNQIITLEASQFNVIQTAYADEAVAPAPAPVVAAPAVIPPAVIDPNNPEKPIDNKEFLDYLWKSFNGWKGLGAMGIAALITQILAMFMNTPLFVTVIGFVGVQSKFALWIGKWKLATIVGLSLISGICMLIGSGLDWKAALVHSSTLTFAQIFFNQVWKQSSKAV